MTPAGYASRYQCARFQKLESQPQTSVFRSLLEMAEMFARHVIGTITLF
jgi:hypothetical protein